MKRMKKSVEYLDFLANHFAFRDWDYTRVSHIKDIKYTYKHDVQNQWGYRWKRAFRWLFGKNQFKRLFNDKWYWRFIMFHYSLKRDKHTPDGVLDGGNIITFWEETGEYLTMMQPTVGALLVNFLKEEPEHPHAKLITAELDRLHKRFMKRDKDGEVSGETK